MAEVEDYKTLSADNNASPPTGAPERHIRSETNNIMREVMGAMRRDWEGTATGGGPWRNPVKDFTVSQASSTSLTISGVDATAFFPAGRKVKIPHATGNDVYAFVASSSFGAPDTTVTVQDFDDVAPDDVVRSNANALHFYAAFGSTADHGIAEGAFEGAGGTIFVIPTTRTAAGINDAITLANTEGKIVSLEDATYNLEAKIEIPVAGARLWGRSTTGTILLLDSGRDHNCIEVADGARSVDIRNLTVDGNEVFQTSGADGIHFLGNFDTVNIENVLVTKTYDRGIFLAGDIGSGSWMRMHGIHVTETGSHGIQIEEFDSSHKSVFIDNALFEGVGEFGAQSSTADCIRVLGNVFISNVICLLTTRAGHTGSGINLMEKTVLSNGSESALSNFSISGIIAGATLRGLIVGGRNNKISNGYVALVGASAIPLLVEGIGSGSDAAQDNELENVTFDGGSHCEITSTGDRTELHNCHFKDQTVDGLRNRGNDSLFKNCTFIGQADGLSIESTSVDAEIKSCTFRDQTGDGVSVVAGATGTIIGANVFRDIAGVGIRNIGTGTVWWRNWNEFDNVTGFNIDENVGDEYIGMSFRRMVTLLAEQMDFGTAEVAITGMEGVSFPIPPDGIRNFLVKARAALHGSGTESGIAMRLRMGDGITPGPTHLDDTQFDIHTDNITSGAFIQFSLPGLKVHVEDSAAVKTLENEVYLVPAANDQLTLSVDASVRSDNDVIEHGRENGGEYFQTYLLMEYVE